MEACDHIEIWGGIFLFGVGGGGGSSKSRRAFGKVGRFLVSLFPLRLVWGVEFDHWCGDQTLKRTFPELF